MKDFTMFYGVKVRVGFTYQRWILIMGLVFSLTGAVTAQQLKLLGFSSGGHVNTASGTQKLSGSIGVSLGHSTTTLKGGIMGAASGLLIENFPPSIEFTEILSFDFESPQPISATVKDPVDGVEYATLWIRPIGGNTFDSLTLTKGTGDNYSISIPSTKYDRMGFEYYLAARDLTLKRSRLPASGNYYAYAEIEKPSIPDGRFKPGSKREDYRIITVPYSVGTNSITQLFDELGTQDQTKWRLFSYEGADVFKEFPQVSSLEPSRAYWMLITEDHYQTLELSTTSEKSPEYNQADLFELTLKPGWNLIGNPYTISIDWSDVQDYNADVQVEELKRFTGTYTNTDVLEPFEGGFVYLDGAINKAIKIPFKGQSSSGGRKGKLFSSDISSGNWVLDLELHQADRHNALGGIGMHTDASITKDRYDDHNPPRFQSYLEVNFIHPEHPLGSFSQDIVPTQDDYKWAFTVDASDQLPIVLQWDNQGMGENDIDLYLHETGSASIVNMRQVNSHTITQPSSFQIYFGRQAEENIAPEIVVAGKAFPNPFNPFTSVEVVFPFALPPSSNEYLVSIDVMDGRGQHVKRILNKKLPSGFYEATWQGVDEQGRSCSSGMYLYRITILQAGKVKAITEKLIIAN